MCIYVYVHSYTYVCTYIASYIVTHISFVDLSHNNNVINVLMYM